MPFTIRINSIDQTARIKLAEVNFEYTAGSRAVLSCLVIDPGEPAVAYRPQIEWLYELLFDGVLWFTGKIISSDEEPLIDANEGTGTRIRVVDYGRGMGGRLFTAQYGAFKHTEIVAATTAKAKVRFNGTHNDLALESRESGKSIDGIYSLQLHDPKANNSPLSYTSPVTGEHIVKLATDAAGVITTVANDIKNYGYGGTPGGFVFYVTLDTSDDPANNGTGLVTALPKTILTGAVDAVSTTIHELQITNVSAANPAVVTTAKPHQLTTGMTVRLTGVASVVPSLETSDLAVTVLSSNTFSVPVNVTTAGTGGLVNRLTRLETIVTDMAALLTVHGITLSLTGGPGPWILPITYERVNVEDALSKLLADAGWSSRLTPARVLEVFVAGSKVAAWSLTEASGRIIGSLPQRRTREKHINRIHVVVGEKGTIGDRSDSFIADGVATSWVLLYGFESHYGYITHAGVAYGIGGPEGWTFNTTTKTLSKSGTVPGAGTTIVMTYRGDSQFIVIRSDTASITALGGEIYEDSIKLPATTSVKAAESAGDKELTRRSATWRTSVAVTRHAFELPGTVLPVTVADRLMSGNWMIMSTRFTDEWEDKLPVFTYELLEAGYTDTWVDFWKGFGGGGSGDSSVSGGGAVAGAGGGTIDGTGIAGKYARWIDVDTLGAVDIPTTDLPSAIPATKIANGAVSDAEFQHLDGVTSGIQGQFSNLNASNLTSGTVPVARLPTTIPAANIANGSVVDAEFQYLDGVTSSIQTQLNRRLVSQLHKRAWEVTLTNSSTGTSAQGYGCDAITVGTFANVDAADGPWARAQSSTADAIRAVYAGITATGGTAQLCRTIIDPVFECRIKTGAGTELDPGRDLTSIRIWVGIASSVPLAGTDNPTGHYAMFRYSGGVDTTWVATTKDNVTQNVVALSDTITRNTEYLLRIRFTGDGTTALFSVNDGAETALTVNLPDPNTTIGMVTSMHSKIAGTRELLFSAMGMAEQ